MAEMVAINRNPHHFSSRRLVAAFFAIRFTWAGILARQTDWRARGIGFQPVVRTILEESRSPIGLPWQREPDLPQYVDIQPFDHKERRLICFVYF
jgi:hypothetical protein